VSKKKSFNQINNIDPKEIIPYANSEKLAKTTKTLHNLAEKINPLDFKNADKDLMAME
jgi:hypothetical protein